MFSLQGLSLIIYTLVLIVVTLFVHANIYPQLHPCPDCPPCPPSKIVQKIIRPYVEKKPKQDLYTRSRRNSSINSVRWVDNSHCDNMKNIITNQFKKSDEMCNNINFVY